MASRWSWSPARSRRRPLRHPAPPGRNRDVGVEADQQRPEPNWTSALPTSDPPAEHPERDDRLAARCSTATNAPSAAAADGEDPDPGRRPPGPRDAAFEQPEDHQRPPGDEQPDRRRPCTGPPLDALGEVADEQPAAPSPTGRLTTKIHRQDAYSAGSPRSRGPRPPTSPRRWPCTLHPGPLRHRVQVADDGEADGLDRPRAQPLDGAPGDEHRHGGGGGAHDDPARKPRSAQQHGPRP